MRFTNLEQSARHPSAARIFQCVFVLSLPLVAQVTERPLQDFISAQGTTQCFTPPAPAQVAWATGCFDSSCTDIKSNGNAHNKTPYRFALIDYTGLIAAAIKPTLDLGTKVSGTVTERALADGRALVTVNLHTTNALGWSFDGVQPDYSTAPLSFGYRLQDLLADPTLMPALGDAHFRASFTNSAVGAPLPDLVCLYAAGCPTVVPCPDLQLDLLSMQASIRGPLHAISGLAPEGAPGHLDVTQISVLGAGALKLANPPGPLADAFPVESISLKAVAH